MSADCDSQPSASGAPTDEMDILSELIDQTKSEKEEKKTQEVTTLNPNLNGDDPEGQRCLTPTHVMPAASKMPTINQLEATLTCIRERAVKTYGQVAQVAEPDDNDLKNLTCAVCLEVYVNPKFLPCYHTFCAACIRDLYRTRPGTGLKCPKCRKELSLGTDGVDGLQDNFYIKQEELDCATRGFPEVNKCTLHAEDLLDMLCTECDQLVCIQCVVATHQGHNLKDLGPAAKDADTPGTLETYKEVLAKLIVDVSRHVDIQKQEQEEFEARMAALKRILEDRRETMLAVVKKCYDQALDDMNKVMEDVCNTVVMNAKFASSYQSSLTRLQKMLDSAITTKSKSHVVEADTGMRVGFGSPRAVEELLKQSTNEVHRPSLYFEANLSDMSTKLKEYFGTVVDHIVVKQDPPLVTITEKFRLGDGYDTEVFSICPKDDGQLTVSYQRRALNENAPGEGLDAHGKHLYTPRQATGMVSWKSRGNGKGVYVNQQAKLRKTYSKGPGQCQVGLLRLDTSSTPSLADVKKEIMISENPFKTRLERDVQIKCGLHRAFDVDCTNTFFAVLEEPKGQVDFFRTVLLFRRGQAEPVDIYPPEPGASVAPSDVCFMQLGPADPVLVVADERNNCLSYFNYQEGKLQLRGQLDPAYPHLLQPLALNTDHQGRLWVCCRGGAVFTVESKSSPVDLDPAHLTPPPPQHSSSAPSIAEAST